MTMYGKKKKSLFSSFSTYHEDGSSIDGRGKRTTYSRLPKDTKVTDQSLRSLYNQEDSIDQLANEILDDITLREDYISTKPLQKKTNKGVVAKGAVMHALNKPLPQLPYPALTADDDRIHVKRSALSSKSTNTKLQPAPLIIEKCKHGSKRIDKRLISHPLHLNPPSPSSYDFERHESRHIIPNSDEEQVSNTAFTTAAAEDLGRKINGLMALSNQKAAEKSGHGGLTRSKTDSNLPGLLKGKEVFAKVRHAFADRFSPKAGKKPSRARVVLSPSLSNNAETTQVHDMDGGTTFETNAFMRIESGNDGILKAQGHKPVVHTIPRKPLPIYHSTNTTGDADISSEDPFSDEHEIAVDYQQPSVTNSPEAQLPRQRKSRYAEKQKLNPTSSRAARESKFVEAFVPPRENTFLDMFSSSPSGHSTPRVRLEPKYEPGNREDVSYPGMDRQSDLLEDEDEMWVRRMQSKKSSTSLKRKKEEQEAGYNAAGSGPSKKLRRPTASNDVESLATKLGNLGTNTELQQPKSLRPKSSRASSRDSFIASGLEFLSSRSFLVPTNARKEAGTQGSFSAGFDYATDTAEERKVTPKQKTIRRVPNLVTDMDIDELHMDLPEYRITSRML